ncbi:bifunctional DNA primase/polymerase [Saccharolobus islandicus]|uniref:Bifunctional DNA primase/polymerase n=1 Tax=Saccharolobus islandicus (strain M.16.27) TaxID=427318 RepID=C3N204_SACI3|nr:bifunctional DNA primase/polymerase [Sulfolobus islandicus]ACP54414.1 Bifunctional DNA primase/polymerase [Sulfolobus islandicus M.16.27]
MTDEILDYALFYHTYGLSVIPLKPKEKVPLIKWEKYQKELATIDEIKKWFENNENNIAIICGKVSGNLVVIDFDDAEIYEKFLKEVEKDSELAEIINNTWLVKTGKGYHIYLRIDIDKPVKIGKLQKIDVKGEGGYVVAPPSIHPSGKTYEFVRFSKTTGHEIRVITEEQYKKILTILENVTESTITDTAIEKGEIRHDKKLSENTILRIIDILSPVYKEGVRHDIVMYLSGWLYKAGIELESAKKLILLLCDKFKDEECNDRIYTLERTYGLKGNQPPKDRLKTSSGLYEIFSNVLTEADALGRIRQLEEILESAEPQPKVLIELLNYEKEIFAIAHLERCEILTATRKVEENGQDKIERLVYKDRVIIGCPRSVTAIESPFSQVIKYDFAWYIPSQNREIKLENVTVDEILAYLKANGLVLRKNLAEDVLNAILNAMLRKKIANVKTGFDAPGFYWHDNKILANKIEVRKHTSDEVREALELLNELINTWFARAKEQFVTAVKLGLLLPFSFAVKQKFKNEKGFLPWLYLYGKKNTGKTTTAEIILYIYNIMNRQHELGVGEVNTEAKLGSVLASDTFPHVINEGASLFDKPGLNEVIKQAIEGVIARQRFENKTIIKEYPAFASLIITTNEMRITDDALTQKRLVLIRYPIEAQADQVKIKEFREKVVPRLPKLKALGDFVVSYLLEHPDELTYDWINLSKKLLEEAYKFASVGPGFDLDMLYVDSNEEDPRVDIVAILWRKIMEIYNKRVEVTYENGNYVTLTNPIGILHSVLEARLLDFMVLKGNEVFIRPTIKQLLEEYGIKMDSMPSLAELFADYGFRYEARKPLGKTEKVVVVNINDLDKLFSEFFGFNTETPDVEN